MADKPIPAIRAVENPFGDFSDEQMAGDPTGKTDRFFLKGYSDKRHERDLEIKKAMQENRNPVLEPLPRRFQYVSVEGPGAKPDKTKYVEWVARGYRAVKWDELASLGIDVENSTPEKGPDGTVRVGSQLLMVADAAVAARHFRDQRELTEKQFEDHVKAPLEKAAEKYNAKMGHSKKTGTTFELDSAVHQEIHKDRR